jgi:hypothetical protein
MSICILKNEIYSSSHLEKQLAAYFIQPEPTPTHTIQKVHENPQDQSKVTIALDVADILVEIRQAIRAKNYSDQLIELYAKKQSPALERLLLWSILRSKLTEPQLDLLNHIIQQQQRFKRKLIRADFQPVKQSSLKTMFSQFAVHWLQATQDKDISSYLPSVGVGIEMPTKLTPDKDLDIKLNLRNKNPLNLYAIQKLAFEQILKYYKNKYSINTYIINLYNVFGEKDNEKIIPIIIKKALKNEKLIFSNPLEKLSFTYVKDVINFLLQLSLHTDKINDEFDFYNTNLYTVKDIIEKIEYILNKNISYEFYSNEIGYTAKSRTHKGNITSDLIYGLTNTLNYYKETN